MLCDPAQYPGSQEKALGNPQIGDLDVDVTPRVNTVKVSEPPERGAGLLVRDVATLVNKLKNEAKVI